MAVCLHWRVWLSIWALSDTATCSIPQISWRTMRSRTRASSCSQAPLHLHGLQQDWLVAGRYRQRSVVCVGRLTMWLSVQTMNKVSYSEAHEVDKISRQRLDTTSEPLARRAHADAAHASGRHRHVGSLIKVADLLNHIHVVKEEHVKARRSQSSRSRSRAQLANVALGDNCSVFPEPSGWDSRLQRRPGEDVRTQVQQHGAALSRGAASSVSRACWNGSPWLAGVKRFRLWSRALRSLT